MGIERGNLRWCAAFHEAKGHPHTHVVFWEKNPQRTTGRLASAELRDIKKTFAGEVFREGRLKMTMEKSAMRELVRNKAKGSLMRAKEVIRELKITVNDGKTDLRAVFGTAAYRLSPELTKEKELAEKLYSLSLELPGKGGAAFQFMPENVKVQAKAIADYILRQPGFKQEVEKFLGAQEQLAITYTTRLGQVRAARDKAYNVLQKRVANLVVKGAADINRAQRQEGWDRQNKVFQTNRAAKVVWKSCWKAVESERQLSEAQAEMLKRTSAKSQSMKKDRAAADKRQSQNNLERGNEE